MKATVNLDGLHRLSSFHRRAVLAAPRIGCFHCCEMSKPSEIKEWIDVRPDLSGLPPKATMAVLMKLKRKRVGMTALCPRCGIDSVLPDRTYGFRLTRELLQAMARRWFQPVPRGTSRSPK